MCLINGRIRPLDDNYTSVSIKGKALVGYVMVAQNCLEKCISFKVQPNQLFEATGCMALIGEHTKL